jgi:hypothetical protein
MEGDMAKTVHSRRWLLASLLGVVLFTGCNPGSLSYFLLPESKEDPEYRPLTAKDKEKGVKAAILIDSPMEIQTRFVQLDRQLSETLAVQVRQLAQANQEKIQILPTHKVEDFKNTHPDWKNLAIADVGRMLGVDYVINLDITKLSLVEPGNGTLLRGRAQLAVTLVDVAHPEDTMMPREFSYLYPQEAPTQCDFDTNPWQFRQEFLSHLARRLSFFFIAHSKRERMIE